MMEKTSNHVFGSALIKATACAFLSMGCLPVWAKPVVWEQMPLKWFNRQ